MEVFVYPVVLLACLGTTVGLILLLASKKFAVKENPLVEELSDILPGTNCGACGFAGCRGLAEGFAGNPDLEASCPVGGEDAAGQIAEVLGVERKIAEKKVARLLCGGTDDCAARAGTYQGIDDCVAVDLVFSSTKLCVYGCMGRGTCVKHCAFDAIELKDGVIVIDEDKCVGCGACVKACPRGCLEIMGRNRRIWVACHSKDKGAQVRKICTVGCIGCKKCEKECPTGAIKVDNFYAHIKQELCSMCGTCAKECPTNAIIVKPPAEGEKEEILAAAVASQE